MPVLKLIRAYLMICIYALRRFKDHRRRFLGLFDNNFTALLFLVHVHCTIIISVKSIIFTKGQSYLTHR